MAGLGFPRDLVIEAYLNGWVDVTTQVRQTNAVSITRGRSGEQAKVAPSKLSMVLDNTSGDWNPSNPLGAYYGLLGRNTPFRLGIKIAADNFSRTVSNGWGTATAGGAWSTEGTASLFAVNGSGGTQQVNGTGTWVGAWLSEALYNAYVAVTYTPSFTDVTGGAIEPANIMLRRLDTNNYYMLRLSVTTSEQYQLQVIRRKNGSEAFLTTGPVGLGVTHTSGQALRVCAMIEGRTIFAKAWLASGPEPYDWHVIVSDEDDLNALVEPGSVGIRSGVATGNSNAKPITFTYDNLDVRDIRMAGELSEITQDWDESHANKRTPVKVEGPLRRLSQGDTPVKSALRRAYEVETANPLLAYWACEDGPGAAYLASAFPDDPPMRFYNNAGSIGLAANDDFACSAPLPNFGKSHWHGVVPEYTPTGKIQLRYLLSVPSSGAVDNAIISQMYTTGTALRWEVWYHAGGALSVNAYNAVNANIVASGPTSFAIDGKPCRVSVELQQQGGDVFWGITVIKVGDDFGGFFTGTLVGHTIGRAADVNFSVGEILQDVAVGHITVQGQVTSLFDQRNELKAWAGELAGNRFERLCDENNIPHAVHGNVLTTAAMGPQKVKKLPDLLQECADADQGILYELRSAYGLAFRTRRSLYSQPARMTLDYAQGQVASPLKPAEDDRGTINDVTAKQLDGSEFRAIQETGPLNVGDPWTDPQAVGRYDTTVNVNVHSATQLADVATFVRTLGTTTDPRFPTVPVDLRAPDVAAITARVLAADIGDRAMLTNLAAIHVYDDVDQMVQGYTETFGDAYQHGIKFNATPYAGYRSPVLDAELGRLDSDTSTLNEDLDETETSVEVVTSGDTRWITTASYPTHFPFSITVGGEEMTVTAISGTGSVQTFTVVRSANGVVKTHSTGAEVQVTPSAYLGR